MLRSLLLLALLVAAARADDAVNKDLLDLAADLDAGKDVTAKLKALHKKHDDLTDIMKAYKPRKKGGLGHGPEKPADSLESAIFNLAKKPLTKDALAKQKDELLRLASLNRAVLELATTHEPPKWPQAKKAKWREFSEDMRKATRDFADAVRKADPVRLKKAAEGMNAACINCHALP